MFTITICPRCGKDFMFHSSDYHLTREVAFDPEVPQVCSYETICQECHEKEIKGYKDFCLHIEEGSKKGVSYSRSDLIELAIKYGCEVPDKEGEEK